MNATDPHSRTGPYASPRAFSPRRPSESVSGSTGEDSTEITTYTARIAPKPWAKPIAA